MAACRSAMLCFLVQFPGSEILRKCYFPEGVGHRRGILRKGQRRKSVPSLEGKGRSGRRAGARNEMHRKIFQFLRVFHHFPLETDKKYVIIGFDKINKERVC